MVDTPTADELLTTREVADLLRVASSTVIRWARTGFLPGIRAGRDWRFRRADVEQLLTPITPDTEAAG